MNKIKKNDIVIIICGKCKGKIGSVIKFIDKNYVIVSNINLVYKNFKNNKNIENNGLKKIESKIHISNISYFDKENNKRSKIGFKIIDNNKYRFLKSIKDKIIYEK